MIFKKFFYVEIQHFLPLFWRMWSEHNFNDYNLNNIPKCDINYSDLTTEMEVLWKKTWQTTAFLCKSPKELHEKTK